MRKNRVFNSDSEIVTLLNHMTKKSAVAFALTCLKHQMINFNSLNERMILEKAIKMLELWLGGGVKLKALESEIFVVQQVGEFVKDEADKSFCLACEYTLKTASDKKNASLVADELIRYLFLLGFDDKSLLKERKWQISKLEEYQIQPKMRA